METRGRDAVLSAFDRLLDRAISKLNFRCTPQEKDEAKRHFVERYDEALRLVDQADLPEIPEAAIEKMEAALDKLSPAHVAGYLAAGPLAMHVQESMRTIALRAAEQRLIEHLVGQADETYGGN